MKDRCTIVYYTHNQENSKFEKAICDNILAVKGDIPLISVSQKPMPWFGHNICVGEVGMSGPNGFRQLQIGAQAATTPFIISAESDDLYPPDYFQFVPPTDNMMYRYDNLWVLFNKPNWTRFQPKAHHEGAQICGRQYLIDMIGADLDAYPIWNPETDEKLIKRMVCLNPRHYGMERFHGENPVVTIKSGNGLHGKTGMSKARKPAAWIPYWGTLNAVKKLVHLPYNPELVDKEAFGL